MQTFTFFHFEALVFSPEAVTGLIQKVFIHCLIPKQRKSRSSILNPSNPLIFASKIAILVCFANNRTTGQENNRGKIRKIRHFQKDLGKPHLSPEAATRLIRKVFIHCLILKQKKRPFKHFEPMESAHVFCVRLRFYWVLRIIAPLDRKTMKNQKKQ